MIVTAVPPAVDPLFGLTPVTVGCHNVGESVRRLPLCPFTVTVTVTAPALPAGL